MMPIASPMFGLGTETADQIYTGDTLTILSSPLAHRPLGCIHDASAREATHDCFHALFSPGQTPDFRLHSPAFDEAQEHPTSCIAAGVHIVAASARVLCARQSPDVSFRRPAGVQRDVAA